MYGLILYLAFLFVKNKIGEVIMYQALYRKWRPSFFDDVVGQEHITSILKSEVENGKLSHAYLFCGPRGTGKTTCAKIIAKAAGLTITGIESIAEGYSYTSESARNAVFKNAVAEDSAALGQTVVQSAKLSVEASVTMIFIAE